MADSTKYISVSSALKQGCSLRILCIIQYIQYDIEVGDGQVEQDGILVFRGRDATDYSLRLLRSLN